MWIYLNDAMLSVVQHNTDNTMLHVRARVRGDLERCFPNAEVIETPDADYGFRCTVERRDVAMLLSHKCFEIQYTNFKDSVAPSDTTRKAWYSEVWSSGVFTQSRDRDRIPANPHAARKHKLPKTWSPA